MSVTQLKDGRWICQYPKGKDKNRPTTNKKYFGRGPEAEKAAWEFNQSLGLVGRRTRHSPTITELSDDYLDHKENRMTISTYDNTCIRLEKSVLPFFGSMMAHSLTFAKLDEYISIRKESVKMTTIRNDLAVLRAVLNWSFKRKLIATNPMAGYILPKKDNTRILPPSKKEIDTIVACAVSHIKRAILITYYTGVRPGKTELLSLRWEHVDFVNETIMVTSAEKGGIPVRMIPLSKTLKGKLEEWHKEDEQEEHEFIVHYYGRRVDSIKKGWYAAKKRAKITRRLRLYDLRHSFVTTLLEKGADLKSVSELAGHASPDITMSVYQHVSNKLKRNAVDLLE